jgi:hypothetical protein
MLEHFEFANIPIEDVNGVRYHFIGVFEKFDYGSVYPPTYKMRIKLHSRRKFYLVYTDMFSEGEEISEIQELINMFTWSKGQRHPYSPYPPLKNSLYFATYRAKINGDNKARLPTHIPGKGIYVFLEYVNQIVDVLKEKAVQLMLIKPTYEKIHDN